MRASIACSSILIGPTARLLSEGERTYGRHREIDAIDPKPTLARCPGAIHPLHTNLLVATA